MKNIKDLSKEFSDLQKASKLLDLCSSLHEGARKNKLEQDLLDYLRWPLEIPPVEPCQDYNDLEIECDPCEEVDPPFLSWFNQENYPYNDDFFLEERNTPIESLDISNITPERSNLDLLVDRLPNITCRPLRR